VLHRNAQVLPNPLESCVMDTEIREINCALIEEMLAMYPSETAVVIEMLREIDEIPCHDMAA
jgi:hypothetical protein